MKIIGIVKNKKKLVNNIKTRLNGEIATINLDINSKSPTKNKYNVNVYENKNIFVTKTKNQNLNQRLKEILNTLAKERYDYTIIKNFEKLENINIPCCVIGENKNYEPERENIIYINRNNFEIMEKKLKEIQKYETIDSLVEKIKKHPDSSKAGAIATFTGRVRAENKQEKRTTHLKFEKYDRVANKRFNKIRREIKKREGVYEILTYHKTGVVNSEEDVVHVVVLAGHRREAFKAVEDGINRIKEEIPLFKKEFTEKGKFWVHNN